MILVIGYGNPLRTDDAIGQHVAWELKKYFKRTDLLVQIVYQLTPELVEIVSHFDYVIFIDARIGTTPGQIIQEEIRPYYGSGALTHNVNPAALLAEASVLYDKTPAGMLISVVGDGFDYGTNLSPCLCQMLPHITTQVVALIKSYTHVQSVEENNHA
jgi:hydrogenase maturation protease